MENAGLYRKCEFSAMTGKTLSAIILGKTEDGEDRLIFKTAEGETFKMYYDPDWCASCTVEDICGDLEDLLGNPLLLCEEVTSKDKCPDGLSVEEYEDSYTWTFYKLSTIKGSVTIRWFGRSNGHYSESVTFAKIAEGIGV